MSSSTDPTTDRTPARTGIRLCVPVTDDADVGPRWCQSRRVAIADVEVGDGGPARITAWQEHEVGWDHLHDEGVLSEHHDRMAAFLTEHEIRGIVVDHVGSCLRATLVLVDVAVHSSVTGPARAALLAAARRQPTG